jgi:competence protein ComEC
MTVLDLSSIIQQFLPEPHAGLLSGILFGTKATLSMDLYNALVNSGTLHIVALSGTNITILIALTGTLLLRLFSRRVTSLLTITIIIGFVWFVGPSPSVIRAAIMGCITLIALVIGKQVWAFWAWVVAVSAMLIFNPANVSEVSFLLSGGATLGMILFGKKPVKSDINLLRNLGRIGNLIQNIIFLIDDDLRTTLSAQSLTIPITLVYFHRISLISPIPNLLIGWILPPLTGLGLVTVILGLIWYPMGQFLAWFTYIPLEYIIRVVTFFGQIPFASVGF